MIYVSFVDDTLQLSADCFNRYTDFLVNEVAPDGSVVHLNDDRAPKRDAVPKVSFPSRLCSNELIVLSSPSSHGRIITLANIFSQ